MGEPGSPIPPPAGGPDPHAGGWGNLVSPSRSRWEGLDGRRPRAGGGGNRVAPSRSRWEGLGGRRPRAGGGATGLPPLPFRWEGLDGRRPRAGGGATGLPPLPFRREGLGGRRPRAGGGATGLPPLPFQREGLGGRRPPRNYSLRSAAIGSRRAARTAGNRPKNSPTAAEMDVARATAKRETFVRSPPLGDRLVRKTLPSSESR